MPEEKSSLKMRLVIVFFLVILVAGSLNEVNCFLNN